MVANAAGQVHLWARPTPPPAAANAPAPAAPPWRFLSKLAAGSYLPHGIGTLEDAWYDVDARSLLARDRRRRRLDGATCSRSRSRRAPAETTSRSC